MFHSGQVFYQLVCLLTAFDTIDHDLLLNHFKDVFGIRDTALAFFGSYLSGREQTVSVLGRESELSSLLYGVPSQDSVLGPILFILFTQPLSDIIERHSSSCTHSLYLMSLNVTLHPVHTASV